VTDRQIDRPRSIDRVYVTYTRSIDRGTAMRPNNTKRSNKARTLEHSIKLYQLKAKLKAITLADSELVRTR